ncbi:OmpA family protein [Maribacter sp. MAR_2009_72]|uniref:OmpA family protein n=1 Tax=Maribacter sp. MAR_2009_72 TaxID=1250050 RepID=UPI00119A117F|nr:OmpA family protein [Maribacter sp. MAR_2009_72]TVZ15917.1 outer membrane protein OmpA-like peptidoglycan-associated protein [Maribacter sp. MAR_2009_72]
MSKTTTNLLLMLITIVAGTFLYIYFCSECGSFTKEPAKTVTETPATVVTPKATSFPFAIQGEGLNFSSNDNYNFNLSSNDFVQPLSAEVNTGISELKSYLDGNENQILNITGYYTSDEENNTAFPNLGLARANSVKNDLASKGVSTSQINTLGKLMDDMVAKDGIYYGPVSFGLDTKSETADDELKALYDAIQADPLILYFNTAQASITLDAAQRQKIADISKYLDRVKGAQVDIVGHTDNTGKASTNMRLGLDRANFAKDYLLKNGISEDKIITSSKGQTDPIADNATEEGRDKNRRTVITLK